MWFEPPKEGAPRLSGQLGQMWAPGVGGGRGMRHHSCGQPDSRTAELGTRLLITERPTVRAAWRRQLGGGK